MIIEKEKREKKNNKALCELANFFSSFISFKSKKQTNILYIYLDKTNIQTCILYILHLNNIFI